MGDIHVPLAHTRAVLSVIPDATPAQHHAAVRYLRRRDALDLADVLGLAEYVPAHLESDDDGT